MEVIIPVTLFAFTVIQLIFWLFIFPASKRTADRWSLAPSPPKPVAVLICARNEADNLQRNLPKILSQDYPTYRVYVIDDGSTDETPDILKGFSNRFPHLHIISPPNSVTNQPGKKHAIRYAMPFIEESFLLFTDADSYPVSRHWITHMTAPLHRGKNLVLGFSPYEKEDSWLNRFIRYDTCYAGIQYLSFANLGMPYMGVGRNMAYSKTLFEQGMGFDSHFHIISGDDDLFVNEHATPENCVTITHPDSLVYSKPEKTWKSFINQRKRHLQSSKKYHLTHQYLLVALHSSQIAHYLLAIWTLLLQVSIFFVISLLVMRWLTLVWVFYRQSKKLECSDLSVFVPLLDIMYTGFYTFLTPALWTRNQVTWHQK